METKVTLKMIEAYIDSKQNAWSPSTRKSEGSRLKANLELINQGPEALFQGVHLKPYSKKTLFIRVGELLQFINGNKVNPFKAYLKDNALAFKNAYTRVPVADSFTEAKEKLSQIKDKNVQLVALAILRSGMRAQEALKYDGEGAIIGKGSKLRSIFVEDNLAATGVTYIQLYRELKKVGLKPHDLRKLAASKLVEAGLKEADLMAVFGWSSITTAGYYLQSKKDDELKAAVKAALT